MLLIPAIGLKGGKCVFAAAEHPRGKPAQADDPVKVAQNWVAAGARRLQIMDLDSVASGKPENTGVIREIVSACAGVPVQVCGGMRSDEIVENYFAAGVEYVVLGTKSATTPHFINNLCLEYPGHILVTLDVKNGKVAAEGWSKLAHHPVLEVAEHFQREGVAAILYCDKSDGATHNFNIDTGLSLAQAITIPVIMAAGLTSLEDIRELCKADKGSLGGAILEATFANGALDFAKAQQLADSLAIPA